MGIVSENQHKVVVLSTPLRGGRERGRKTCHNDDCC